MGSLWQVLLVVTCLLACSNREKVDGVHVVKPAPVEEAQPTQELPSGVAPPEPTADEVTADRAPTPPPTPHKAQATPPPMDKAAAAEPAKSDTKGEPAPKPEGSTKPAPTKEPEPGKPTAPKRTHVPSTAHVRIVVPAGMQKLLDADSRMQPWVNQVVQVADRCFAKERAKGSSGGTIAVTVTMHPNARPTPDIDSLPPSLAGVVACATGELARAPRMPLFTGPEGERHKLSIRFTP